MADNLDDKKPLPNLIITPPDLSDNTIGITKIKNYSESIGDNVRAEQTTKRVVPDITDSSDKKTGSPANDD